MPSLKHYHIIRTRTQTFHINGLRNQLSIGSSRYSLPGLADDGDEDVAVADDGEGDDDGHHDDLAPPDLVVGVHC